MAAIPTILKGDDSGSIIITMATGRTYTGATLIVAYQGVTKTFTNLTPGGAVNLVYSHDETAKMAVKTAPVLMRLVGPTGGEETVENAEARIRVTDCLAEVNAGGSFSVAPHTGTVDPTKVPITDVGDMSARYSLADLKAKVDQIVRVLAQRSLLSLGAALCAASVFGASSSSARLDALYNDSTVVTNVSFAGLLTSESDPKWTSDKPNFLTATNAAATYQPKGNYITSESDPTVPAWAKAANPPESGKIDKIYTNGVEAVAVNKNVYLAIPEGGGGAPSDYTTTNAVKSIVNAEVGGTNTLVHSGAISDMATKTWVGEQAYWKNGQFASWGTSARGTISLSSGPSGTTFEAHGQNASASFSGDSKIYIDLATVDILYPNMVNIGTKDLPTYVGDIAESKVPANIVTYTAGSPSTSSAILSSANATAENIASQKVANVSAIVATWENFLDGSNVVFSITNYISCAYSTDYAKLRILEMRNGAYQEVFNSHTEITNHIGKFKSGDFKTATNSIVTATNNKLAQKADKAWGQYTSAGGEAPSNTVYMTAPNTVFAGGMEYERVAVGEGSVCVLTTKGAPVWTSGDEGTFKFQDDGGTNYFGFAKTDSYTIGCDTDGISVNNHIVSLTYNVTMSGVPCIWYKADLANTNAWEKLNLPDGTAVPGASHTVSWDQSPAAGTEVCYINCPEAKGFFKASIEVTGSAKFMTNMPADFGGGILCTDGIHKVKINWNNGSPTFVEVQ